MRVPVLAGAAVILSVLVAPAAAPARTLVLPHFIERSGRVETTTPTFDTSVILTYTPGQAGSVPGGGATAELYLYDNTGLVLKNGGNDVCNPCDFPIGGGHPHKRTIVIDDLITATGTPFDAQFKLGFGVLVVSGADPDGVVAEGFVVNSITGPFAQSRVALPWIGLETENPCPIGAKQYVIPHASERNGLTSTTANTFDTSLFATYAGGVAGLPDGGGATLDVYLFGDDGTTLKNNGVDVCNPCLFNLSAAQKKLSIRIDDLVRVRGGAFDNVDKTGYMIVIVGGADPDRVTLQGLTVNSHETLTDLDLSALAAHPVPITAAVGVGTGAPAGTLRLGVVPNPAPGSLVFSYALEKSDEVELSVFDATGRRVATLESGRRDAGPHQAKWDGRGDAGTRARPGMYFGRLTGGDGAVVTKVVILP